MRLTLQEARTVHLAAQGFIPSHLPGPPREPQTDLTTDEARVLGCIEAMGALQIDTISVVNRSPWLVLYSRLGSFDTQALTSLLAKGYIFEYWSHAACFLPTTTYPWYRRRMLAAREEGTRTEAWFAGKGGQEDLAQAVLQRIKELGPLRSSDFEPDQKREVGWWNWKAEKVALEYLFDRGELVCRERQGFQRVYDLAERVQPFDDAQVPSMEDYHVHQVLEAIRALGVAPRSMIADYFRQPKKNVQAVMDSLQAQGLVTEHEVHDFQEPWFSTTAMVPQIKDLLASKVTHKSTVLLSPFDPVVWDRQRLKALFGMDYTIEVYTPEAKRCYGYYSMPILHRGAMVGRLDPKAHRDRGIMEIRSIHLETSVKPSAQLAKDLVKAIKAFAAWHLTPKIILVPRGNLELLGIMEGLL